MSSLDVLTSNWGIEVMGHGSPPLFVKFCLLTWPSKLWTRSAPTCLAQSKK